MNIRIKFAKYGSMKFISHLDVMRFFQKATRRAGLDVVYSEGFSPHQLMSFAAPLGLGQTSEGEYFDLECHTVPSMEELVQRLNAAMTEGMTILSAEILPEYILNTKKETVMALVAASDYLILKKDGYPEEETKEEFLRRLSAFLSQAEIIVTKKTKKAEREMNIAPFIYGTRLYDAMPTRFSGSYENGLCFSLLLSAGSVNHLKPELVLEAFYESLGREYPPYAYQVHRLETYADLALTTLTQAEIAVCMERGTMPRRKLVPLEKFHRE